MNRDVFRRGLHRVVCEYDDADKLVRGTLYCGNLLVEETTEVAVVDRWLMAADCSGGHR